MWQNPLGIFSVFKYSFFISISNNTYHDLRRQQKLPLNKLKKKINNKEQKEITILYNKLLYIVLQSCYKSTLKSMQF